ncbi:MAG: ribokinase [Clostridia bacterium]|nr:ribokinase [Clostridia bacterium]
MDTPRIVVQGSMLFDFFTKAKELPKVGQTVLGNYFGMFSGGKGSNQAVQLARLGAEVYMIGRVGCDFMGDFLLDKLRSEGMDTAYIVRDDSIHTGLCAVHIDERGRNDIIVVPLANTHCCREDVLKAESLISSAEIVLCQLETTVEAAYCAMELANRHGKPAVLNPAPAVEIPQEMVRWAYLFTPNETEAEFYSGINQNDFAPEIWRELAAERLRELGASRILITLGKDGCFYYDGKDKIHYPAFAVNAVDSTAAGDAFNAALAYALAMKKNIPEAIRYANGAGSLAASRFGSQASLCNIAELEALLKERSK